MDGDTELSSSGLYRWWEATKPLCEKAERGLSVEGAPIPGIDS
jgi:hypothetical protein